MADVVVPSTRMLLTVYLLSVEDIVIPGVFLRM